MKYHELQTTKPKAGKRVGRGIAAGQGKTAGRGTKGQGAR
ncbi:MAG TPA: 50S ribosomal protein L15, partial [Candidatus Saccharimonadales bacterium]